MAPQHVRAAPRRYPNAELLWCQEEPMNMGAYYHVQV
jgi:2-oxoglutarate dehydrogenase E1 component